MPALAQKGSLRPGDKRVLVLNADYRPLNTWPPTFMTSQEAVLALIRERVSVVEEWPDVFFRSPSIIIPVPKIVALREYAPVRGEPKCTRRNIYLRDRYRCQYCGQQFPVADLTYDHVIPRSKGGQTVWSNILTACLACNGKKGNKMPNYSARKGSGLRPLKEPRRPSSIELLKAGFELLPNDIIEDFGSALYWGVELDP